MPFRNKKCHLHFASLGIMFSLMLLAFYGNAQNSPYSRFGLGDVINMQNVANRAMGGVAQAYGDGQTLNFVNPASYSNLQLTTLDLGVDAGVNHITDQNDQTYKGSFGSLSYLQLGVPLKRGGGWGLVFGLKPVTDVSYDIQRNDSLSDIGEKVAYFYKGHGGSYQAFVGTGFRVKGFRFGVNAGYLFGSLQRSTQAIYPSDSLSLFNSNATQRTGYGGFFWNAGLQVHIKLSKTLGLELGATGGMGRNLTANSDYLAETFYSSGDPSDPTPQNLDTVSYYKSQPGKIYYPGHYGFGFLFHDDGQWTVGVDYEVSQWGDYKYFGERDSLQDSHILRLGAQYVPSIDPMAGYWSSVAYRVGFYTGGDYLRYNGNGIKTYAVSFGAGLPIRNFTRNGQYTILNTAFEIGKRGGKADPLSDNFFRVSVGFTLSDLNWFVRRKYQ